MPVSHDTHQPAAQARFSLYAWPLLPLSVDDMKGDTVDMNALRLSITIFSLAKE
jgi:hypothetical protein